MFTPAGEQSRRQRTTRARPRTATADPPTTPLTSLRPHLYNASETVREQDARESKTKLGGAIAHDSTARPRYDTASEDETYDTFDTQSVNARMSAVTRKLRLSSQDIENSLNRRRSLRSASRSLDPSASPGSSRRASLNDYSNGEVSIEYDVTQSSLEHSDGTFLTSYSVDKETQFHEIEQPSDSHQDWKGSAVCGTTRFGELRHHFEYITEFLQRAARHFKQVCRSNCSRTSTWTSSIRAARQLLVVVFLVASLLGAMAYLYQHDSQVPFFKNVPLYDPPSTVPKDSVELFARMLKLEKVVGKISRQIQWLEEGVENIQQKSLDDALLLVEQGTQIDGIVKLLNQIRDDLPSIQGRIDDFNIRYTDLISEVAISQTSIDTIKQTIDQGVQDWQASAATIKETLANLQLAEDTHNFPDRDEFVTSIYDDLSTSISNDVLGKMDSLLSEAGYVQKNWNTAVPNSGTWLDFLRQNKHELTELINAQHNERIAEAESQGRLVSRTEFLSTLKGDFRAIMERIATYPADEEKINYDDIANDSRRVSDSLAEHLATKHKHSGPVEVFAQPDYAAYTSGARINPFLTSPTYLHRPTQIIPKALSRMFFNIGSTWSHAPAVAISSNNAIGMCWAFPGSKGQLSIRLSRPTRLRTIVVEHLSSAVAHDTSSAPRDIEVWAHLDPESLEAYGSDQAQFMEHEVFRSPPSDGYIHIMDITYQLDNVRAPIQVFHLPPAVKSSNLLADQVLLRVTSNWGHGEFTCLYRVRVGGVPADQESDHNSMSLGHDEEI